MKKVTLLLSVIFLFAMSSQAIAATISFTDEGGLCTSYAFYNVEWLENGEPEGFN